MSILSVLAFLAAWLVLSVVVGALVAAVCHADRDNDPALRYLPD